MKFFQKFVYVDYLYRWEWNLFQNIEMMILCYDKLGIGRNCAIHKLVVVRIRCYEIPIIERSDKSGVLSFKYRINNISCQVDTDISCNHFRIFFKYLVGNAHIIVPIKKRLPYFMVITP